MTQAPHLTLVAGTDQPAQPSQLDPLTAHARLKEIEVFQSTIPSFLDDDLIPEANKAELRKRWEADLAASAREAIGLLAELRRTNTGPKKATRVKKKLAAADDELMVD